MTFIVMSCHWHKHHVLVPNDTDASTSNCTGTESHVIPLNNLLNMTNAKVSLMAPSALCGKKYVIAMYMPQS